MTRLRRAATLVVSTGLGIFLVWLLFWLLPVSPGEAIAVALSGPVWLYAAVAAVTLANLMVGALKWRKAASYLSDLEDRPSLPRMLELTSLGEFFGQVMPVQLSTLLVRWVLMDGKARASGYVARSTFFEQAFDLILVLSGCVAAIAVIGFGLGVGPAVACLAGCVGMSLLLLRSCLRGGAKLSRLLERTGPFRGAAAVAARGFEQAAAAPSRILASLSLYSLLRLLLVALRVLIVMAVFAPLAPGWLIMVASPLVTLLTSLPVAPAGLGLAEWSWSAVLVYGGTAASVAAIAALAIRLTNIVALVFIVIGVTILRQADDRRTALRRLSA